jgi:serine/threonine protein kinase
VYPDGKKIAVKLLTGTQGFDDKQFQDELKIMTRLRHQNIVRLVGYCNDTRKVPVKHKGQIVLADEIHRALCLEYMDNGSLDRLISGNDDVLLVS